MAVPKYHEMMLPILQKLGEISASSALSSKQIREFVCERFYLTDSDRSETIPSGLARYMNNAQWACTYLKQAGLIESPKRGVFCITERGRSYLERGKSAITKNDLMEFPEFVSFSSKSNKAKDSRNDSDASGKPNGINGGQVAFPAESTPEDILDQSFKDINTALAEDLLELILQQSPDFFERLVVDLLLAMGYGDSRTESGTVTKKTGDGGIDGIVREDKLGFDNIYIQAKRWDTDRSVCAPDLQAFVGALTGAGANKGLFITTARFSSGAREYAEKQHAVKLVLVDGDELARLMIAHGVGVSVKHRYEIKSIDSDYFDAEGT